MTLGKDWSSPMLYELVRHVPSGEVYVIAPAATGGINAIAGPLHHSEFEEAARGNVHFEDRDVEWANGQDWAPHTGGQR